MAIFEKNSRYAKVQPTSGIDRNGRRVNALDIPEAPAERSMGEHLLGEGQRLDHLANYYLEDGTAYWRIAEVNDAMTPDALARVVRIKIPERG